MMQRIFSRYQWSSIDKTTYSISNKVLRYSIVKSPIEMLRVLVRHDPSIVSLSGKCQRILLDQVVHSIQISWMHISVFVLDKAGFEWDFLFSMLHTTLYSRSSSKRDEISYSIINVWKNFLKRSLYFSFLMVIISKLLHVHFKILEFFKFIYFIKIIWNL